MRKGVEDLDSSAIKKDMEKGYGEKWTRTKITWKRDKGMKDTPCGSIDPTASPPPPAGLPSPLPNK
jgi:hypothetical protein